MLERREIRQALDAASSYVSEVLDVDLHLGPCEGRSLPPYLTNAFAFACGRILGLHCVFAVGVAAGGPSPASLAKQLSRVKSAFDRQVVYVTSTLPAHQRKRLVAQKVPFIVPFTHLYLPPLGLDFRETTRNVSIEASETFKPVTQVVLLHALLLQGNKSLEAKEAADGLNYSLMSISRAFRDLEAAELAIRRTGGRSRPLELAGPKREVWKKAQSRLLSPVTNRYVTDGLQIPGMLKAGLNGLAHYSSISPPQEATVAVSPDAWRKIRGKLSAEPFSRAMLGEPDRTVVEVWSYPPEALSSGPSVDILSLALTLRSENDERIEAAVDDALESLPW